MTAATAQPPAAFEILRAPLNDPSVWHGRDIAARRDWVISMTPEDLAEIDAAMRHANAGGRPLFEQRREDFPLDRLAEKLAGLRGALEGGRGFVLLRGLPVDRYDGENARTLLWGLGNHIGTPEAQDRAGNLMHDVRDTGKSFAESDTLRDYQTDAAITFHNDGADIFMLFCLKAGRRGGESLLVSAVAVFNEVLRRRPHLAALLQQPCWYMDTRGQRRDGARYQVMPIYTWWNGQLTTNYKNSLMHAAQRFSDVPPFSPAQLEALDLLGEICADPEFCLRFEMRPGDIQIANNYATFHGRTKYEDFAESEKRRHMLRMWLTLPNGRKLPPNFEGTREFGATYARRMSQTGSKR